MKMKLTLCVVLFSAYLSACNNTQIKNTAPHESEKLRDANTTKTPQYLNMSHQMNKFEQADQLHTQGLQAYDEWEKTKNKDTLLKANQLFKQAFDLTPYSLRYQNSYYYTFYEVGYTFDFIEEKDLLTAYNKLHPAVRRERTAPAKAIYAKNVRLKQKPHKLIPVLHRAVLQRPRDSHTWSQLSEQYLDDKKNWLAIATASKAVEIRPDSYYANIILAEAYNRKIEENACFYDEKEKTKRAAYYGAKATKIKPTEFSHHMAGVQYLRLGIYPLARTFSEKSVGEKPDKWNVGALVDIYRNMHLYDKAIALLDANPEINPYDKHYSRALKFITEKNYAEAHRALNQSGYSDSLYSTLVSNWLRSLETDVALPIELGNVKTHNQWQRSIKSYFEFPEVFEISVLVDSAENNCQKVEAHFYTAFRLFREGEKQKSIDQLKLAKKAGATRFDEHFLANSLLKAL